MVNLLTIMTIDILLATYNGAKFLRPQLDSIVNQTNQDWRLVVRDDGSRDETPAILREYQDKYGTDKIIILPATDRSKVSYEGLDKKIPVIRNFSALMKWSKEDGKADYFMFCDQDDIWDKDKVDKTLAAMKQMEQEHGTELPLMVHTDARMMFPEGTHPSFRGSRRGRLETTFKNDLVQGPTQGCTVMMNRKLADISEPIPDEARMHDMWVGLIAKAIGKVSFIDEATMDYRQHEANVVCGHDHRKFGRVASKVMGMLDSFTEQAGALKERIGNNMPPKEKEELNRFLEIAGHRQPRRGLELFNEGYSRAPWDRNITLFGGRNDHSVSSL